MADRRLGFPGHPRRPIGPLPSRCGGPRPGKATLAIRGLVFLGLALASFGWSMAWQRRGRRYRFQVHLDGHRLLPARNHPVRAHLPPFGHGHPKDGGAGEADSFKRLPIARLATTSNTAINWQGCSLGAGRTRHRCRVIAAPFWRLQGPQRTWRLSGELEPPRATGMMWSNWSSTVAPQCRHDPWSLVQT